MRREQDATYLLLQRMKHKMNQDAEKQPDNKDDEETDDPSCNCDYLHVTLIVLKVIIWCLLMTLFVLLEFGAVFFILSVFYFMFTNFRKTSKEPAELSAYSVFNPNCESIKGTLTAEQFENEIKFGLGSLH